MHASKTILTALLVLSSASAADVERVTVHVEGMACPFCAYNIEKRVKTLETVGKNARVEVVLDEGTASFPWKAGAAFDPASVDRAVRDAGFTPARITIEATGDASALEAALRFRLRDARQVVALSAPEKGERSFEALAAWARSSGDKTAPVRVRAEVSGRDKDWKLVLLSWEPLEFGAGVIVKIAPSSPEKVAPLLKALARQEDVIHLVAASGEIRLWTRQKTVDLDGLRSAIEKAGLSIEHVHELGRRPEADR